MQAALRTGGEVLGLQCDVSRLSAMIEEGADNCLTVAAASPTVSVCVERDRAPFSTQGWPMLTRGAWHRGRAVVVRDVCTSGLDLHVRVVGDRPEMIFRWRPPSRTRAAMAALPARARLLVRCVLLQYPVLWWAATNGRVPLHASVLRSGSVVALLAGASGVGKSTLVATEIQAGATASSDNLCITDGRVVWGIVEPLRLDHADGRRMPHGRRESRLDARVPALVPNVLAVLRRSTARHTTVAPIGDRDAGRALAGGTYMAGELRRFWPFAAVVAAGTGVGPIHPPVAALSRVLAGGVSTFDVQLAHQPGERIIHRLESQEERLAWT
jgi:hypothetical protein